MKVNSGYCELKEKNGFLKYLCMEVSGNQFTMYRCVTSDDYYYIIGGMSESLSFRDRSNNTCANDQHSYQFCGITNFENKNLWNNKVLCGYTLCPKINHQLMTIYYTPVAMADTGTQLSKFDQCYYIPSIDTLTNGLSLNISKVLPVIKCDGMCDEWTCEDEATCNGYFYGFYCENEKMGYSKKYILPHQICDGRWHAACRYTSDKLSQGEKQCWDNNSTIENQCIRYSTGLLVTIFNYTRCATIVHNKNTIHNIEPNFSNCNGALCLPYCYDYKDQTNCTDSEKNAVLCKINGYISTVSKEMICSEYIKEQLFCDDRMDKQCTATSPWCLVHKHLMCNGNFDCEDKTDEINGICDLMTKETCLRKYIHKLPLSIPLLWLDDGVEDCQDGIDEQTSNWDKNRCGVGKTKRYVIEDTECSDVYICKYGSADFIELQELCDGLESCGNENNVCASTHNFHNVFTKLITERFRSTKYIFYCLKGLGSLEELVDSCQINKFEPIQSNILGAHPIVLKLPQFTKYDCRYMYGELYLFISCLDYCQNSHCPLKLHEILKHDSCPGQYSQRIFTLFNNSALSFVVRKDKVYNNDIFTCNNGFCIEYYKVCNLIDDCGDNSDEISCGNHFKCINTDQFLPLSKKCDKNIDCFDFSDECNDDCSKKILPGYLLNIAAWTIGSMATFLNLYVPIKNIIKIKKCKKLSQLRNKVMITFISIGDLLIGVYLLAIAAFDSHIFKTNYCFRQIEWLTSNLCSLLGVMNTFGSHLSVFSMTILSIERALKIRHSMLDDEVITKKNIIKLAFLITVLILSTTFLSVIPLIEYFENYFVNGMSYQGAIPLFIGIVNKDTHLEALRQYYGRMKRKKLKWKLINDMIKKIFTHDYNLVDNYRKKVSFYGNDGVCVFKYFVMKIDPQSVFTCTVLSVNSFCFLIISVSYLFIGIYTVKGTKILARNRDVTGKRVRARNKKLQQKILLIIATDFVCWIPFVVICFIHFFEKWDASPMYSIFSIVFLPVNSVINPLLYEINLDAIFNFSYYRSFTLTKIKALIIVGELPDLKMNNHEEQDVVEKTD